MTSFFVTIGLIIFVNAFLCLYRAVAGPTVPDRVVAVNIISTMTMVILILIAYIFEQSIYLDVAFVYALLLFVVTVAVARYLESGGLPE